MGWFDDDSDEEDNTKKRLRGPIDGDSLLLSIDDDDDSTKKNDKKESNHEEEEDPLDAYMKTLKKAATKNESESADKHNNSQHDANNESGERLDVENEHEATSHWIENANNTKNNDATSTEPRMEPSALEKHFQKSSTNDDDADNIRLQQVKHHEMNYAPFQKCFFPMSQAEAQNNSNSTTATVPMAANTTHTRNTLEGHAWRTENHVTCQPPILDPIYDFAELYDILPEEIIEWNASKNLTKPTLVQKQTLGVALCGKDAIVTASTGSGKTLAYLWPVAIHLVANHRHRNNNNSMQCSSRSLVLVPTRELALQVEQIARSMFAKLPLKALAIIGGNMGRYQLSQKLTSIKPNCVIATPGRLLDVLKCAQTSNKQKNNDWLLPNITLLVLDEADKMIQMGFSNQVTQILSSLRPDRQSLLVSATFDSRLEKRCREWMHTPVRISVGRTGQSSRHVDQHVLCLPNAQAKTHFLIESLPTFCNVGRTLVFCATRQGVESLAEELRRALHQLPMETLHGDKHLSDRKAALRAFTKGNASVLIATDVAGRGLDIPHVATVINFDPAKNWDTHVHRIGRAGRLSSTKQQQQKGSAYTLLLPSNKAFARSMIRAYEREGRTVPPDVQKLVGRQHHSNGNHASRNNISQQTGVGLQPRQNPNSSESRHYHPSNQNSATNNYYGPASKRSKFE